MSRIPSDECRSGREVMMLECLLSVDAVMGPISFMILAYPIREGLKNKEDMY